MLSLVAFDHSAPNMEFSGMPNVRRFGPAFASRGLGLARWGRGDEEAPMWHPIRPLSVHPACAPGSAEAPEAESTVPA